MLVKISSLIVCIFLDINNIVAQNLIDVTNGANTVTATVEAGALRISLIRGGQTKLTGQLAANINGTIASCGQNCVSVGNEILTVSLDTPDMFTLTWTGSNQASVLNDCFDLGTYHWYGGPEQWQQYWPIEKLSLTDWANVPKSNGNAAVAEPYWLSSSGAYIFVDAITPLFITQGSGTVCFSGKQGDPYLLRPSTILKYMIVAKDNAKDAHLHAVNAILGKPAALPDIRMIEQPLWSTWARYKTAITDDVVRQYANEIVQNGFLNSQLEIDDNWEECYGTLKFSSLKFSAINETVALIKSMGFRVTLWIHPFVNKNCVEDSNYGNANGLFVKNEAGDVSTSWWQSGTGAAQIVDFTNIQAQQWFSNKLNLLKQSPGIDSFKFDAGETSWTPQIPVFNASLDLQPNIFTTAYVNTVAQFGNIIEVRSGYKSQQLPVFIRMIDKDSRWDISNGLYTLVTTLLQMNMNGYTLVLPDMVGGNGYILPPTKTLFIRWLQANIFMPSIQFSYVPWDFDNETIAISHKMLTLRASIVPHMVTAMQNSVNNGVPVNPPLWWADPTDETALACDDQFMVGDSIIVAPIVVQNALIRDIYLPAGSWIDGNTGTSYQGPITLTNYPVPLDVIPYFVLSGSLSISVVQVL